jgi:hypothetical protein
VSAYLIIIADARLDRCVGSPGGVHRLDSSGSPSLNLQLIGVHLGRDDKNVRYGAAIDAIVAHIAHAVPSDRGGVR